MLVLGGGFEMNVILILCMLNKMQWWVLMTRLAKENESSSVGLSGFR